MTNKIKGTGVIAGIFMLAAIVFTADLLVTQDAAITVLYVAPVLLTLFYPGSRIIIYVSVCCTMLTLITYFISSWSPVNALNLVISITGIWSAFYFIMKFKAQELDDVKNRERLNALFEFATEGMIIASTSGEIVMINPMAEKQFGYQKGELTGKKIELLIPERLSERHVKHREKYVQNPYPRPMGKGLMLFGRHKDGSEFPVEISLSNFATAKGKFVIAFIIDISERRKADELLRKEKEVAQMYLDIAPVIFLVLDTDYTVKLINQNGCQSLGYSENEIIGKKWFDEFVTVETREWSKKTFTDLLDGKISVNSPFENEITTSRGDHRLIAWKNTIIRDETGSPIAILSAGEDITSKKHQEQLIESANMELQRYSDEILKLNADL